MTRTEALHSPLASRAAPVRTPHGALWVIGVVLVGLGGLFLRVWALGRAPVNSDEAVVGLMAHAILHGHFFAFYWGQSYGAVEPYVVAATFAVFGQSCFSLVLGPLLLNLCSAVVVWRLGCRLFSARVGVGAALLFWVWPLVDVWRATYEDGFRQAALLIGLIVLLYAARLSDRPRHEGGTRLRDWVVLGAAVGLGWWSTPEITYFVLPAAVVLLARIVTRRLHVRLVDALAFVLAFVVGDLPWLWTNLRSHFASLRTTPRPGAAFAHHLHIVWQHVLPLSLGLQLPLTGQWLLGRTLGVLLVVGAVVLGTFWLVVLAVTRRALLLVVFVVAFPFIYAYLPTTWYWQDGRYALYFSPVAALLVVSGVDAAASRLRVLRRAPSLVALTTVVVVVAGLALTLGAARQFRPYAAGRYGALTVNTWTSWHTDPSAPYAQLAQALEHLELHDAYAGYWVAYMVDFESRERLVLSDVAADRYPPYLEQIARSKRPGWVFFEPPGVAEEVGAASALDPGCSSAGRWCLLPGSFEEWLHSHHDSFDVYRAGAFLVIVPHEPVPAPDVYLQLTGRSS